MTRITSASFVLLVALSAGLLAQTTASPEALLKAAIQREQVDGDSAAALAEYQAIVAKFPTHAVAAEALLRMAGIYQAKGDQNSARAALLRVAEVPGAGADRVTAANARLAALDAGLMDRRVDWPTTARMAADVSFSPDGRYVNYVDQPTGELAIRNLRTGQARLLTNIARAGGYVEHSAISRDSAFIAFVAYEKGRARRGLRVLPLTAAQGTPPRLIADNVWMAPRQWMPDGKEVLVTIQREGGGPDDLGLIRVSDGSLRRLQQPQLDTASPIVALSPGGSHVAVDARDGASQSPYDIFLVPTDGGASIPIFLGPSSDRVVGWAPDGRHLIFHSDRDGSRGIGLWALPIAGGRPAGQPILLKPDFRGDAIGISSHGALLYESLTAGTPETTLFTAIIDPETGKLLDGPRPAAHDRRALNLSPRWSGDGKQFLYTTVRPSGRWLSIRSENHVVREVPRRLNYVWTFDVSPDGSLIAFRATNLKNQEGIFLMDTRTGDLRTVALKVGLTAQPDGVGYYRPEFSADGTKLFYFRSHAANTATPGLQQELERDLRTWEERIIRETTAAERAARSTATGLGGLQRIGRSLDRRVSLHASNAPTTRLFLQVGQDGPVREVLRADVPNALDPNHDVRWTPDGRVVLVKLAGAGQNERSIWWIPVDSGSPRRIDLGRTDIVDTGFAVHPDGRQLAFVAGDPIESKMSTLDTEFRLLENFMPPAVRGRR
jgi:Tol biopolymer transport system component